MDNKFNTIHIVAEMAIISGMFYYFNKRIKTLESEMAHIKKTYVDTFDDVYKKIELVKTGILQLQTTEQILKSSNISNSSNSPNISNSSNSSNSPNISNISNSSKPASFFRQANVNSNYENVTPKSNQQKSGTPINETTNSEIKQVKQGETLERKRKESNQEKLVGSYIEIQVPNIASQLINNVQTVQSDIFDFFQGSSPEQRTSAKVEVIEDDEDNEDIKQDETGDKHNIDVANEKTESENDEELNEDDLREIDSILLKDKKDI